MKVQDWAITKTLCKQNVWCNVLGWSVASYVNHYFLTKSPMSILFSKCPLYLVLLFSLSCSTASGQDKPTISIVGSIDDSVVTVHYTVPAKAFFELSVFNRQGYMIDVPLSKELTESKDSIRLRVADYLTGSYYIQCKVNHSPAPISLKQFRHTKAGEHVTFTPEEVALHNKMPACDQSLCTIGELSSFQEFFKKYPHYLDKGEVWERALLAYIKLDQDSVVISRAIDSLVTCLPSFWSYYTVTRYLVENHKLPSLASMYLTKARDNLASVPLTLRDDYNSKLVKLGNETAK